LLQIWILPEKKGLEPGYEQTFVGREEKLNRWKLVGSRDGRDGSLTIHQDVDLLASVVEAGTTLEYALGTGRQGFLQVVGGSIDCNGEKLEAGDAVAVTDIACISVTAKSEAELLLFDLA
jgi:redox-sensitive bicupin YhaK (pirin superfamily)